MLFPEHEWPPLIDPDGYRARVATGRERASRSSVLFCGMGRDVIGRLDGALDFVERAGSCFRRWAAVFYENDSTDGTAERFRDWAAIDPMNRFVRSETLGRKRWDSCRDPARTVDTADYRERNRRDVLERAGDAAHVVVLDLDLSAYSVDGLMHTFGLDGWDCMNSNGLCWHRGRWVQYDAYTWRDLGHPAPMTAAQVHPRVPCRGAAPVPVLAAFGGMACYPIAAYRHCVYTGETCEHVGFQSRLAKVFVNPSQLVLYELPR